MHSPQIFAELTRLYALEVDAAQAYSAAVAAVVPGRLADELALFGLEHQRHVLVLHELIAGLGYSVPAVTPDVKGVVIGALTPPRRRLTLEDVLEGVRGNEQLTNSVYAKVIAKPIPAGLRARLVALRDDEERHLFWAERMVSRRVWLQPADAHP